MVALVLGDQLLGLMFSLVPWGSEMCLWLHCSQGIRYQGLGPDVFIGPMWLGNREFLGKTCLRGPPESNKNTFEKWSNLIITGQSGKHILYLENHICGGQCCCYLRTADQNSSVTSSFNSTLDTIVRSNMDSRQGQRRQPSLFKIIYSDFVQLMCGSYLSYTGSQSSAKVATISFFAQIGC